MFYERICELRKKKFWTSMEEEEEEEGFCVKK
jgi:hypothetical protein